MKPLVPEAIQAQTQCYLALLDRWNERHALTALAAHERYEELILDSWALLPHLQPLSPGSTVVDFGTGMGIPAIPLALARPDLRIIALDKSRKKIAFVRQAVLELGLENLDLQVARAEELPSLQADAGVAKAVGSLDLLTGWWARHGRREGTLWLLKGDGEESLPPGWRQTVHSYSLPTRGTRAVLQIQQEPGS